MSNVYIFDPTASDSAGKVRGMGRYMQVLRENLSDKVTFIENLNKVPYNSTLFNPFINFLQPPFITKRFTKRQIGSILDLILLKYPHHFPLGIRGNLRVWNNKRLLKNYDEFITISGQSKKDIHMMLTIPNEKIHVVHPTLAHTFWENEKTIDDTNSEGIGYPQQTTHYKLSTPNYLLYVGDATWNKNLLNLAKAIEIADIPCVFVGKIFEKKLEDLKDSKEIIHPELKSLYDFLLFVQNKSLFQFPGYVSDTDLISLYKHALCNIFPSYDEGFGYSYVEAGALGTPSILSDIDIFHEIAKDTGLFIKPHDPHDIAQKIIQLEQNPTLRKEIGEKAQQHIQQYQSDDFRHKMLQILDILS
ncbi:MAG: glycosyltransferase family 1 protein [Candidatus Roizmanbacteria bacterium]